ncbi:hypothetical protein [Mycetocola saprophilus]|uniref:hypothetical protein n=1 Tax=Mycetocola saprophilus TaxID=76636 RepID=UPI003BF04CD0
MLGLERPARRMVIAAGAEEVLELATALLYRRGFYYSRLDLNAVLREAASAATTTVRVMKYGAHVRGFFHDFFMEDVFPLAQFAAKSVRNTSSGEVVIVSASRNTRETVLTLALLPGLFSEGDYASIIFGDVLDEIATHFRVRGCLIEEGSNIEPRHLSSNSPAHPTRFELLKKLARKQGQRG